MPAVIAVLLFLTPFALYLAWRRYGGGGGEPHSGTLIALLLGVGLMLGAAVWFGLDRSLERGETYVPSRLGPDGRIIPGGAAP